MKSRERGIAFLVDPSTLIDYQDELADLMRERFGPKEGRPVRYTAAFSLTSSIARLLSEGEFTVFLQSALRGERESRGPDRPFTWTFHEYFARALRDDLGEFHTVEGRQEAWHIMLAMHSILPGDAFSSFIRCAYDAWGETVDCAPQVTVRA